MMAFPEKTLSARTSEQSQKKPVKCYIGQTLCQDLAYRFGHYHQKSLLYSKLSVQLRFELLQNVRVLAYVTRIHACR